MPGFLALCVLVASTLPAFAAQAPIKAVAPISVRADASRVSVTHPIAPGDHLSAIMARYGIEPARIPDWVEAASPVADLSHIECGHTLQLTFTTSHRLVELSYDRGDDGRVVVEDTGTALHARLEEPPVVVKIVGVRGTLQKGFYRDARSAGVPDDVISRMVDLLNHAIDFRTETRTGDRFRLLYEQRTRRDGRLLPPGRILAADYVGRERSAAAFLYRDHDDNSFYVDRHGAPLEQTFLRYPLEFTRISSDFSAVRFHPILKQPRPHLGVDFAAEPGTPVRAVGDGTIAFAGWKGDFGFHVELEHSKGLTSTYSHLRGIAPSLQEGRHVTRGQLVGWVGQTGLATGPHLHFAMFEDGNYLDPLTVNPSAREFDVDHNRFRLIHTAWMHELRSIPGSLNSVPSTIPEALSALTQARRQGAVVLTL